MQQSTSNKKLFQRKSIALVAIAIVLSGGFSVLGLALSSSSSTPKVQNVATRKNAPTNNTTTTSPINIAVSSPITAVTSVPSGSTLLATITKTISRFESPNGKTDGVVSPTWDGAQVTVPVIAQSDNWYEIRLPQRPNETTAWVKSDQVSLSYTPYRIVVNLTTTMLTLEKEGKTITSFPAGVGSPTDPTPTGNYFVSYFAKPPSSGYGPFVMVTSAHSNAITDWEHSGDAEIAIHGPLGLDAEIGTTGASISHGCVRLHVADLQQLRDLPVGTPITIEN